MSNNDIYSKKDIDSVFDVYSEDQPLDFWEAGFSSLDESYDQQQVEQAQQEEEQRRRQQQEHDEHCRQMLDGIEDLLRANIILSSQGPITARSTGKKLKAHLKSIDTEDLGNCLSSEQYQHQLIQLWHSLPLDRATLKAFTGALQRVNGWGFARQAGNLICDDLLKELRSCAANAPDEPDAPFYRTAFLPVCVILSFFIGIVGRSLAFALVAPCTMLGHILLERLFHRRFRRKTAHLMAMLLVSVPLCIIAFVIGSNYGEAAFGIQIFSIYYLFADFAMIFAVLLAFTSGTEIPPKPAASMDDSTRQQLEEDKLQRRLRRASLACFFFLFVFAVHVFTIVFIHGEWMPVLMPFTSTTILAALLYAFISHPLRRSWRIFRKNGHADLLKDLDLAHPFLGSYEAKLLEDRRALAFYSPGILYIPGGGLLAATQDICWVYERKNPFSCDDFIYFALASGQKLSIARVDDHRTAEYIRCIQQDHMSFSDSQLPLLGYTKENREAYLRIVEEYKKQQN